MNFGEKLQQLRKARGMSQEQLASQIRVSRQAVSKWELGESKPDIENILQLTELFKVSADYLLKDNEEIMTDRNADTDTLRQWPVISLGVILAGLVIAFVGWELWQTLLPIGLGFLIQLGGCILYEVCFISRIPKATQVQNMQKKHCSIAVWGLSPVPVYIIVFGAFQLYPRPYSTWIPYICFLAVYIGVSLLLTLILRRGNQK